MSDYRGEKNVQYRTMALTETNSRLYRTSQGNTHKKNVFLVVGTLRFYPPYTNVFPIFGLKQPDFREKKRVFLLSGQGGLPSLHPDWSDHNKNHFFYVCLPLERTKELKNLTFYNSFVRFLSMLMMKEKNLHKRLRYLQFCSCVTFIDLFSNHKIVL